MYSALKRLVVGPPIASGEEQETKLGRPTALSVLAADALSSTAYATEEMLLVLMPIAGIAALDDLVPLSIVICVMLALVIFSYRQTIYAYPSGGGSYVVSRENLGTGPSLVAGASLLVDYTLTVAVSISAGVAALTSAITVLRPHRVELCIAAIVIVMLVNLRGTKSSGRLFAPPVYAYILSLALLIGYGLFRVYVDGLAPMPVDIDALNELAAHGEGFDPSGDPLFHAVGLFLILRAFSSGAVALTGIEAISNGVPAFRKPQSRNAASTLVTMGTILGSASIGVALLASKIQPIVLEPTSENYQTLFSIMGRYIYGDGNPLYFILQFATFAILVLAANTAFADFPRVTSIIAADGFLPRQFVNRGDRLVHSNGIILLALLAALLIWVFAGDTSALIPLYAVGVFLCFTLSQAGMVIHHRRLREKGWRWHQVVNAVGALATLLVLVVVVVSKFAIGAWIVVVVVPLIVMIFRAIHRHYVRVAGALAVPEGYRSRRHRHTVIVLVGRVNRGVLDAVTYARSLAPDRLMALTVVHDEEQQTAITEQWDQYNLPVELRTIYSPYRELSEPVIEFIDDLDREWPDDIVTVIVPEFILSHWWEQLLHNQSALVLRSRLRLRPNTVVTAVPVHLEDTPARY